MKSLDSRNFLDALETLETQIASVEINNRKMGRLAESERDFAV